MLAGRFTNAQIVELLSISGRTVENHRARAMRKSGVRSRADLYDLVSAPRGWHPRRGGPGNPPPPAGRRPRDPIAMQALDVNACIECRPGSTLSPGAPAPAPRAQRGVK